MWAVTKRKFTLAFMLPYLVINATSLFFHNRRFETPATKENHIEEWAQGLPPPPPFKKQRTSATGSTSSHTTSSKANTNLRKTAITANAATTKSTSRAIVVDSTTEVLKKKPAPHTKRRAEDLESATNTSDANDDLQSTVSNLRYEGLGEDEDDTLEQADAASSTVKASVAAQMSKVSYRRVFKFLIPLLLISASLSQKSVIICPGITVPAQEKKIFRRQSNKELPNGALDNGRWSATFLPTFFRYVGSTSKDIWALNLQDTITALQAIWNEVYKGSAQDRQSKIKHLVELGGVVHNVVRRSMVPLLTISANHSQSNQRVIEWRSSVGSNGLAVVGDFMDSLHLGTTKQRQEAAEYLIDHDRYIYLRTMDVTEGEEQVVCKAAISITACPLKVIQVKRAGRYRGPLVVQSMAQCWVDFDGAVEVPGFVEYNHFPYAALVLSATSVCFPFCTTLNIFMIYRCIVLSGCGPEDISPRRATTVPS